MWSEWRKSRASGTNSNCVELAYAGDMAGLRDSKATDGPVLVVSRSALPALVAAVTQPGR
ncbi:DUF397 domain-containing protein [Actinokineospora sp.]|uniref:DUF397 domain-containing protein n=1 Tax=Actinokineospora sp. TaxID=1872133 RepID=UPI003D6C1C9A